MRRSDQRRAEILRLVGEALTDKEIAARVHLSESGVKNYLTQLYRAHGWYGAGARYKLIRFALTGKDGNA